MNAEVENVLFTSLVACKKAFSDDQETAPAALAEEATRRQHKKEYMRLYMHRYRFLLKEKASKKDQQQLAQKNGIQRTLDVSPLGPAPEEAATKFMTKGTEHEMQ